MIHSLSISSLLPAPKRQVLHTSQSTTEDTSTATTQAQTEDGTIIEDQPPPPPPQQQLLQVVQKRPAARPYGQRGPGTVGAGWKPRTASDFGDGGAFPEIHVAQFPLGMGLKENSGQQQTTTLAITTDAEGRVQYDAIVRQGQRSDQIIYSKYRDLVEKRSDELGDLARPSAEQEQQTTLRTKQALEAIINGKIKASTTKGAAVADQGEEDPTYVRYIPQQLTGTSDTTTSSSDGRILRIVKMPTDPLEPPKFGAKKVPRGPPSPPVPVMHSPPRKLTVADVNNWKIPPSISNWKNPKGYTIPLDKRLAADGRGLQEVQISDKFAKLSEALYIAEWNAREEVDHRAQLRKKLALQEKQEQEEKLRAAAAAARLARRGIVDEQADFVDSAAATVTTTTFDSLEYVQRSRARGGGSGAPPPPPPAIEETEQERTERLRRDKLREERRREREYERRKAQKSLTGAKGIDDADRDVSEKVALGQSAGPRSHESMFDTRLFNQSSGLDSGFGAEDEYNIYEKPLFRGSSANTLYRPTDLSQYADNLDDASGADNNNNNTGTRPSGLGKAPAKFVASTGGTDSGPRSEPVQFERDEEEDPFGLKEYLSSGPAGSSSSKTDQKKRPLDRIGTGGLMSAASGGGNMADPESYRESKRQRIDFVRRS